MKLYKPSASYSRVAHSTIGCRNKATEKITQGFPVEAATENLCRHAGSKTLLISADNNQRTKTTVGHANWISATRGSGKVNRRPQSNYRSIEPAPRTHEGEQKREHHRLGFRKQDTCRKSTNGTTSTRLLQVFTTDCTTANGLITKVVWEILTDRKLPPTHNRGQN
jgi:hypothetical protein